MLKAIGVSASIEMLCKSCESLMVNGQIACSVRYLVRALRHNPGNAKGYIYALALPVYAIGGAKAVSVPKGPITSCALRFG